MLPGARTPSESDANLAAQSNERAVAAHRWGMMTHVLRQYEPRDFQAVWKLHQRASEAAGIPAPDEYFADLREIESAFLGGDGEFVVGEQEGHVVAMGALRRTSTKRAEILRMRVDPSVQRQGFGSAILRQLEECAEVLGCTTMHLETLELQEAAQRFYLRHGYRCVGRGQKEGLRVLFFEKTLGLASASV
jgi:GNAT superfamily N-acetyltransferase